MSKRYILGVDCGTQSLRAALYTPGGALAGQAVAPFPTERPQVNRAEQHPQDWWRALCRAVPQALAAAGASAADVAAVGCDGTSYTGVYCAEDGAPLRPAILWMDLRAAAEAREIEASRHPVLDHCGRHISAEWLLPKTLWVHRHEPKIYAESARVVEGVDWLVHRLTGNWVTSTGNASGKRHWTPDAAWPSDLYDLFGLADLTDKSPDAVLYSGDAAGTLTAAAAEALGLTTDCIVAHAGMDGWVSVIGTNCFESGCMSLTLGTSTVLIGETPSPALIEGIMGPFPEGIRRGYATYEAGQTSGGSTVGWLLALLGTADERAHAALLEQAACIPPGADGIIAFDAWRGNRTPYFDPAARGTLCGLTLEHGPAHLYRAVLEGCAFGLRNVVDHLRNGGARVQTLRACGSGAANPLWVRIIADALQIPVLVSEEKHATCLGSAMCASVACGMHDIIESAAAAMAPRFTTLEPQQADDLYEPYYQAYLKLYRQAGGVMHDLAAISGDNRRDT